MPKHTELQGALCYEELLEQEVSRHATSRIPLLLYCCAADATCRWTQGLRTWRLKLAAASLLCAA
jgi:hypothetical protein